MITRDDFGGNKIWRSFRCFFENIVHEIDDYRLVRDDTIDR